MVTAKRQGWSRPGPVPIIPGLSERGTCKPRDAKGGAGARAARGLRPAWPEEDGSSRSWTAPGDRGARRLAYARRLALPPRRLRCGSELHGAPLGGRGADRQRIPEPRPSRATHASGTRSWLAGTHSSLPSFEFPVPLLPGFGSVYSHDNATRASGKTIAHIPNLNAKTIRLARLGCWRRN